MLKEEDKQNLQLSDSLSEEGERGIERNGNVI